MKSGPNVILFWYYAAYVHFILFIFAGLHGKDLWGRNWDSTDGAGSWRIMQKRGMRRKPSLDESFGAREEELRRRNPRLRRGNQLPKVVKLR